MTKPLHHLQFHQMPPSYEAVLEKDYHHLIILGTGEKANGLHSKYMLLGADEEERKLIEPFTVKSPEELLYKAGEGTAYDVYRSLCAPFGNLEVSILLIDYDYLEDAFSLLENVDFSYLLFDHNMRIEMDMQFVREPDLLQDPTINPDLLEKVELFKRFLEVADKARARGRIVHAISLTKIEDELMRMKVFKAINALRIYEEHEFIEKGRYISVVLDQLQTEMAHSHYAALAIEQDIHESPTNKDIKNPVLRFELEDYEHQFYEQNGVITLIDSYHKGVVFSNCTTAVITEDQMHKHFPHEKIAQFTINLLGQSFFPVIGMAINAVTDNKVNSILSAIRTYLKNKKGYVKDLGYEYYFDRAKGELYLTVIIVPISSVQSMVIQTQVRVVIS